MSNETIADIVAEMRDADGDFTDREVVDYADRIEAAARRERGALVAEAEAAKCARNRVAVSLGVEYAERCRECKAKSGNAAAMRDALCMIRLSLARKRWFAPYIGMVDAALAAPPRNCDVGTAEEQEERFDKFCAWYYGTNDMSGDNCRVCPLSPMGCKLAWAQMPYKEGGDHA